MFFQQKGRIPLFACFCFCLFWSTVLRKGSVAAKGAIPDAFAWQHNCRSSWNCAWLNLPCHGEVWCVVQTPQHKAATREKNCQMEPWWTPDTQKVQPRIRANPPKGMRRVRPRQTAGRTTECRPPRTRPQRKRNFLGPFLCLALCHRQCCSSQWAQKRFFPQFPWGFCPTMSNFATRRARSRPKSTPPQGERLFPREPTRDRRENAPKKWGGSFWPAPRGPKVAFFARYRGPKTRSAPQENPPSETVRQKWSERGLQNNNCAPFFWAQTFCALFRTPGFSAQNKAAQNRPRTRNPQKRSVFAIFRSAAGPQKPEKTCKTKSCEGARSESKNVIFSVFFDWPAGQKGKTTLFSTVFETSRNPYFCSVSASEIRFGLPRSSSRAPSQPRFWSFSGPLAFQQDIYIYICCCVQFRGVFFFANRFKNAFFFFREQVTNENDKNRFFPRWKIPSYEDHSSAMSTLVRNFNAFKNGALMSRNISTSLLNGYARAIFERFNSPSFHTLFLTASKSLKPLFLQRFVTISWVFWAPPQTEYHNIFRSQEDNCKSAFRNKVGAPIFIAFRAPKLKTLHFFCPFHARFRSQNRSQKPSAWGAAPVFAQTVQLWTMPKNILTLPGWPYLNDPPTRLTRKWKLQNPHAKRISQDMKLKNQHDHTAAKKQQPKMRKIKKTKKQTSAKLQRNRSTQIEKTRTQNRTNPKNAGTRDKLDRKKALHQTPKTTIEQQIGNNNKESFAPSKQIPRMSTNNTFCGQKKSTKELNKQLFCAKDIFAKIPERQTKWDSCSFHGCPFQAHAGAWGEEDTKDEKEEEQGKKTQSKNMQTRYKKKTKDTRKHKNKIGASHRKKHKKTGRR